MNRLALREAGSREYRRPNSGPCGARAAIDPRRIHKINDQEEKGSSGPVKSRGKDAEIGFPGLRREIAMKPDPLERLMQAAPRQLNH
jgi:hypothetical protein